MKPVGRKAAQGHRPGAVDTQESGKGCHCLVHFCYCDKYPDQKQLGSGEGFIIPYSSMVQFITAGKS